MLAKAFPRELVEEVWRRPGRGSGGGGLPAWLTRYFALALALFMDRGAGRVMRKLAGVAGLGGARGDGRGAVGGGAVQRAGAAGDRAAAAAVREGGRVRAGPGQARRGRWRGLRLVSLDGTTLDVQDHRPELARFGGPSTRSRRARSCAGRSRRRGCWRWPSAAPGR